MKKYNVAIAGSTNYTSACFDALINDSRFNIQWVLTPQAKPKGRKKITTATPLDIIAQEHGKQIFYVNKKIDQTIKDSITQYSISNPIDFLLVVDFGYFIPNWLLQLPKLAPLNIHPSKLPEWRGSSPAQFSILFNQTTSAITVMIMNNKLDQGDIVFQKNFNISLNWTHQDYYSHAFNLVIPQLGDIILKYQQTIPQPLTSPTITARTLKKSDAFIEWSILKKAVTNQTATDNQLGSPLLTQALAHNQSLITTLERASKAFNPWPMLWTIVSTTKGKKRMKLINLEEKNGKIVIKTAQLEGKQVSKFNEIKNIILD